MLPFELSVIDLILAISVVILIILYITKPSVKTPTREKPLADKPRAKLFERVRSKLGKDSTKCPYGFGYLKKLDKDASIPDKCLVCSRIMECVTADE